MRFLSQCAILLFMFSGFSTAQACWEGEQSLLERRTSGGYTPSDMIGWESGIQVMNTGKVVGYYRKNNENPREYKTLGRLSPSALKAIKLALTSLPQNSSILYPDTPECLDAADTIYAAYNSPGKIFATNIGCRVGYLKSFSKAWNLKDLLDGYSSLFYLMRQ